MVNHEVDGGFVEVSHSLEGHGRHEDVLTNRLRVQSHTGQPHFADILGILGVGRHRGDVDLLLVEQIDITLGGSGNRIHEVLVVVELELDHGDRDVRSRIHIDNELLAARDRTNSLGLDGVGDVRGHNRTNLGRSGGGLRGRGGGGRGGGRGGGGRGGSGSRGSSSRSRGRTFDHNAAVHIGSRQLIEVRVRREGLLIAVNRNGLGEILESLEGHSRHENVLADSLRVQSHTGQPHFTDGRIVEIRLHGSKVDLLLIEVSDVTLGGTGNGTQLGRVIRELELDHGHGHVGSRIHIDNNFIVLRNRFFGDGFDRVHDVRRVCFVVRTFVSGNGHHAEQRGAHDRHNQKDAQQRLLHDGFPP